jgi:hypothetical protein
MHTTQTVAEVPKWRSFDVNNGASPPLRPSVRFSKQAGNCHKSFIYTSRYSRDPLHRLAMATKIEARCAHFLLCKRYVTFWPNKMGQSIFIADIHRHTGGSGILSVIKFCEGKFVVKKGTYKTFHGKRRGYRTRGRPKLINKPWRCNCARHEGISDSTGMDPLIFSLRTRLRRLSSVTF